MKQKKPSQHKEESEKLPHDTFDLRQELYKLMKKVVSATGYGEEDDDYTETISINLGGGTLSYDPYYDGLDYEEGDGEYEIDDEKTIKELISEINRRFEQFESKVKAVREKAASEAFDKPIGGIIRGEVRRK